MIKGGVVIGGGAEEGGGGGGRVSLRCFDYIFIDIEIEYLFVC